MTNAMPPFEHVPDGWTVCQRATDGASYQRRPLFVIVSESVELDGHVWRHVSVSRRGTPTATILPTWHDMALVRDAFIGPDREAYTVHPPRARHVNIHPGVLHLWARIDDGDGAVLPDFTRGSGSI